MLDRFYKIRYLRRQTKIVAQNDVNSKLKKDYDSTDFHTSLRHFDDLNNKENEKIRVRSC